jgi:hypothetical protein
MMPTPPSTLAIIVGPHTVYWVQNKNSLVPRIAVTWTCDQLDWFSLIVIFINNNSHMIRTPQERVSWLLFWLSLYHSTSFPVKFLGCQELFSNSHFAHPREYSPWVRPPFTRIIFVHYPATRNVFQVFWSCKQHHLSKSMNIMRFVPDFDLA